MNIECPICHRDTPDKFQEKHHLIPRGLAKRNKYAKLSDAEKGDETVTVCVSCGDQLHQIFTMKELAEDYRTIVAIAANPDVQAWVRWIQKKPGDFSICMKKKKKR